MALLRNPFFLNQQKLLDLRYVELQERRGHFQQFAGNNAPGAVRAVDLRDIRDIRDVNKVHYLRVLHLAHEESARELALKLAEFENKSFWYDYVLTSSSNSENYVRLWSECDRLLTECQEQLTRYITILIGYLLDIYMVANTTREEFDYFVSLLPSGPLQIYFSALSKHRSLRDISDSQHDAEVEAIAKSIAELERGVCKPFQRFESLFCRAHYRIELNSQYHRPVGGNQEQLEEAIQYIREEAFRFIREMTHAGFIPAQILYVSWFEIKRVSNNSEGNTQVALYRNQLIPAYAAYIPAMAAIGGHYVSFISTRVQSIRSPQNYAETLRGFPPEFHDPVFLKECADMLLKSCLDHDSHEGYRQLALLEQLYYHDLDLYITQSRSNPSTVAELQAIKTEISVVVLAHRKAMEARKSPAEALATAPEEQHWSPHSLLGGRGSSYKRVSQGLNNSGLHNSGLHNSGLNNSGKRRLTLTLALPVTQQQQSTPVSSPLPSPRIALRPLPGVSAQSRRLARLADDGSIASPRGSPRKLATPAHN